MYLSPFARLLHGLGWQRLIELTDRQRGQAVTFDRRLEDRFQIVVVGLGIAVQRPAVMVRRERVYDARVEAVFALARGRPACDRCRSEEV